MGQEGSGGPGGVKWGQGVRRGQEGPGGAGRDRGGQGGQWGQLRGSGGVGGVRRFQIFQQVCSVEQSKKVKIKNVNVSVNLI